MKKYITKFYQEHQAGVSKKDTLKALVNNLFKDDLQDFIEALLMGNVEEIFHFFEPSRTFTAEEIAYDWLVDLPYSTLKSVEVILQKIYIKVLRDKYDPQVGEEITNKIQGIVAINKCGLSGNFMRDILVNEKLNTDKKLKLLVLLAKVEDTFDNLGWIEKYVKEKENYSLYPAITTAYANDNQVLKGLSYMEKIPTVFKPKSPIVENFFASTIRRSLVIRGVKAGISEEKFYAQYQSVKNVFVKEMYEQVKFINQLMIANATTSHARTNQLIINAESLQEVHENLEILYNQNDKRAISDYAVIIQNMLHVKDRKGMFAKAVAN